MKAEIILKELGIDKLVKVQDISDGSHSFDELYDHRAILFMSLVSLLLEVDHYKAYKSKYHADGTNFEGYFLLMLINENTCEQISYHLDIKEYWNMCPGIEVDQAPEWDGHTSDDVTTRLISWFL